MRTNVGRSSSKAEEPLCAPETSNLATLTLPGLFNQAMIEFGATYCLPRNPDCSGCVFSTDCYARKHGMVNELPLKKRQQTLKTRYFHYLVIRVRGKKGIYFRKRSGQDIWKGLYEFPLLETNKETNLSDLMASQGWNQLFGKTQLRVISRTGIKNHLLSHQKIIAEFYSLEAERPSGKFGTLIHPDKIHELPVARILEKFLENYPISEL